MRRTDYILAKLGALVAATWLLLGAPQLVMFAGAAFDATGPREVGKELVQAGAGIIYAAMLALVSAGIGPLYVAMTALTVLGCTMLSWFASAGLYISS